MAETSAAAGRGVGTSGVAAPSVSQETLWLLQPLNEDNIAAIQQEAQTHLTHITAVRKAVGCAETWRLKCCRIVQLLCPKQKTKDFQLASFVLSLYFGQPVTVGAERLTSQQALLDTPLAEGVTVGQAINNKKADKICKRAWRYVLLAHLVHDKKELRLPNPDNQYVVLNQLYEHTRNLVPEDDTYTPYDASRADIQAAGTAYVEAANAANGAPTSQQLKEALFKLYKECRMSADQLGKKQGSAQRRRGDQQPGGEAQLVQSEQLPPEGTVEPSESQQAQQLPATNVVPQLPESRQERQIVSPAVAPTAPAAAGVAASEANSYWQQNDQQFSGEATPAAPENVEQSVRSLVQDLCFSPSPFESQKDRRWFVQQGDVAQQFDISAQVASAAPSWGPTTAVGEGVVDQWVTAVQHAITRHMGDMRLDDNGKRMYLRQQWNEHTTNLGTCLGTNQVLEAQIGLSALARIINNLSIDAQLVEEAAAWSSGLSQQVQQVVEQQPESQKEGVSQLASDSAQTPSEEAQQGHQGPGLVYNVAELIDSQAAVTRHSQKEVTPIPSGTTVQSVDVPPTSGVGDVIAATPKGTAHPQLPGVPTPQTTEGWQPPPRFPLNNLPSLSIPAVSCADAAASAVGVIC